MKRNIREGAAAAKDRTAEVRSVGRTRPAVLITGGGGFLGSQLAHRLMSLGKPVMILDNLSRPGADANLQWLRQNHPDHLMILGADMRDEGLVREAVRNSERVFHFAHLADTDGMSDPMEMMCVNIGGTLTLLEVMRSLSRSVPLIHASDAVVYGDLGDIELRDNYTRYEPSDRWLQCNGVGENRPLLARDPYACSRGAADQYVLAYAKHYRVPAVVLRFGTVYGPRQNDRSEHGWITDYVGCALRGESLVINGDGKQVRDILFTDDAVNALLYAQKYIHALQGQAFNIGGGPMNTVSCNELVNLIANLRGRSPEVVYRGWQPADRRYYVSNINAFRGVTGWTPLVGVREGVGRQHQWLLQERKTSAPATIPVMIPGRTAVSIRPADRKPAEAAVQA